MINGRHISVIIPALNEESSIARVIGDLPESVDNVLVVDNGSNDRTAERARLAGARVISEPQRGYGAACLAGIREARNSQVLAFIDGDYSDYPQDLEGLLEPLAHGHCDLAMGCRQVDSPDSGLSVHQDLGNRLACTLIRWLHGYHYMDLGPMRCVSRSFLESLDMQDRDFGWTAEMQIRACRAGGRILQIPVRYRSRIGQSKISGTLRGSIMAGYKILYWTLRLSRDRSGIRA